MSTNITTVVTTVSNYTGTLVYANCPSGDVALGGGGTSSNSNNSHWESSAPTVGAATSSGAAAYVTNGHVPAGWAVQYNDNNTTVNAFVICSK